MTVPDIPGYVIGEVLGRGGFATVYSAMSETDALPAAIKVMRREATTDDDLRRFERERMSMTALNGHPHIVEVFDSGSTESDDPYIVLELLAGGTIRDSIDRSGALHWATVLEIGVQLCQALDAAHRAGVLHRDLKPANILLDQTISPDEPPLAKLADFGIARLVGQSQVTAAQSLVGTLAYTPPEIFHNRPFDGRCDIYQLGVTLYEMLLGRAPFTSAAAENKATIIQRILENPAPPLAQFGVPEQVSDLIAEVLSKDPGQRPQSAAEFERRLRSVMALLGTASRPELDSSHTPQPPAVDVSTEALETVIEPSIDDRFSVAPPSETPEPVVVSRRTEGSDLPDLSMAQPEPAMTETQQRTKIPWLPIVGLLVVLGAATAIIVNLTGGSTPDAEPGSPTTAEPNTSDTTVADTEPPVEEELAPLLASVGIDAFQAPNGPVGLAFGGTANSQGITVVGGAGTSGSASNQRAEMWTMEPNGTWSHRTDFAQAEGLTNSSQRFWDIAGIDGQQFVAVGETSRGGTDAIIWTGTAAASMRPYSAEPLGGTGKQSIRSVAADVDNLEFTAVGMRSGQPSIWRIHGRNGWDEMELVEDVLPVDDGGRLDGVAIGRGVRVAVGSLDDAETSTGLLLIDRGNGWQPLIDPVADTHLNAVAITAERIVAAGTITVDSTVQPLAIVTNRDGEGFIHRLPATERGGIVRAVQELDDGTIIAVGYGPEADDPDSSDGLIWTLIPGEATDTDSWKSYSDASLEAEGLQELWDVVDFRDQVFVVGRASNDERSPAHAWKLSLPR